MTNEKSKKIAVLLPSMQVGGAERLVIEELAYLKQDPRFTFELHLVFEEGPLFGAISALGVTVHVWKAPHKSIRMLQTYSHIVRYLRQSQFDILHSHLLDGVGPIVGKLAGTKVVATVHNDKKYGILERFALSRSDMVLGCGMQVVRNISDFIPAIKVNVLNNAIRKPMGTFVHRNEVLNRFGIKGESRLIVTLGRLTKQKGYDVLIEAIRRVVNDVAGIMLLIGGEGEEMNNLNTLIESAGLGKNIKLLGLISNTYEILAACDLYVNSSRWEGLPMTLLEAMSHGLSMVATNVGGNPELVHDGVTGILVPPEDPEKIADAIIRILKDDDFRKKASKAAFALFSQEYTIDKHCSTLADYYLQLSQ
jgi:glycosyltransferase involved in cell wall biosynthesis